MLRILLLFGLARVVWSMVSGGGELFSGGMNTLDKIVICLGVITAVNGFLLYMEAGEVVYQAGQFYSAIETYLLYCAS